MDLGTNMLIWIVQSVILALVLVTGFAYVTLLERRVVARFQSRVGPNRVGPYGLLQPLADGVKLIFKEEVIPDLAESIVQRRIRELEEEAASAS